jgi:hypothetical protein
MATWPHEETPLTEREKAAYRYLLYQAMLDIRMLCQSRGEATWDPREIWQQYRHSRIAGSLADWLHNLGHYSMVDFHGFNTDIFWQEYEGRRQRLPQSGPHSFPDYRWKYEEQLTRLKKEQTST